LAIVLAKNPKKMTPKNDPKKSKKWSKNRYFHDEGVKKTPFWDPRLVKNAMRGHPKNGHRSGSQHLIKKKI
jgi:hypothetical protein